MPTPYRRVRHALMGQELVRPPSLQTGEQRTASWLELFFDLAFVLVIAELAGALRGDVTLHGVAVFAGLFSAVWWSWVSSTLYANRFDHDDVVYRLYKLTAMLAVIGLAATATEATGARAGLFAGCQVALRLVLLAQYARAYRSVEVARPTIRLYLLGISAGAALWAASLAVPVPLRFVLWALAVLVEVAVPILATAQEHEVPLHLEHLPERFSLFVILVLGESVAAVAHGVHDARWTGQAAAVGVAAFILASALWWSWFDLASAAAKGMLDRTGGRGSTVSLDVYVFGQLPLCLALASIGVGIQLSVLQSARGDVPFGTRLLLAGGVALYLVATTTTNTGMARRWRGGLGWPFAAAALAAADTLLALPAVALVGGLAALVVVVVLVGLVHQAEGRLDAEPR